MNISRSESEKNNSFALQIEIPSFNPLYNESRLKTQIRQLKGEAQKMEEKFNSLVHYASLKGVNVNKQIEDMKKIIKDRSESNLLHQNEAIQLLYETKMRRTYCNQIEAKLSENSSKQLLNSMALEKQAKHLIGETAHLTYIFEKWVQIASGTDVKIQKQVESMNQVLQQLPNRNEHHQSPAVVMLYELTMRTIYCNQIIRKCAKSLIHRTATEARIIPKLREKKWIIDQCELFLMKKLPPKLSKEPPYYAESKYDEILEEINKMQEKLLG